jgi:hypothetical protein
MEWPLHLTISMSPYWRVLDMLVNTLKVYFYDVLKLIVLNQLITYSYKMSHLKTFVKFKSDQCSFQELINYLMLYIK